MIANDTRTCKVTKIGNRSWRERRELVNKVEILEWLERKSPKIVIATDGSSMGRYCVEGRMGGRECFIWFMARNGRSSAFRSETEALEDALAWILDY